MASFTSKATGNWNSSGQTTWNEVGVPGSSDTVTIANAHIITISANATIGATTVNGGLTTGTGVIVTLNGDLIIGNGTGNDGTITYGAGSTLALGSYNLLLNNCRVRSNANSSSWAYITGSGAIATGGISYPIQDIQYSYVSHQNTGGITYAISVVNGGPNTSSLLMVPIIRHLPTLTT